MRRPRWYLKIVDILKNMKKEDLSDKSILLGSPEKIIQTLKRVENAVSTRSSCTSTSATSRTTW